MLGGQACIELWLGLYYLLAHCNHISRYEYRISKQDLSKNENDDCKRTPSSPCNCNLCRDSLSLLYALIRSYSPPSQSCPQTSKSEILPYPIHTDGPCTHMFRIHMSLSVPYICIFSICLSHFGMSVSCPRNLPISSRKPTRNTLTYPLCPLTHLPKPEDSQSRPHTPSRPSATTAE